MVSSVGPKETTDGPSSKSDPNRAQSQPGRRTRLPSAGFRVLEFTLPPRPLTSLVTRFRQ